MTTPEYYNGPPAELAGGRGFNNETMVHAHRGITTRAKRDTGLPTGFLNPAIRRFR